MFGIPGTCAPVIDAVAESNCDLLFLCSYLADSIGLVRTIRGHRFRPKMVGGGMIGPQNTAVKTTLGPLLNGFVNYDTLSASRSPIHKASAYGNRSSPEAKSGGETAICLEPVWNWSTP